MSLGLFVLLCSLGAWAAWRDNPLYSERATLRLIAVAVPAITVFVAAVAGAAALTTRAPETVAFGILGGIALTGTLALIWLVTALAGPPGPRLPAATRVLHVHRSQLRPWTVGLGCSLPAFAVLALALPPQAASIADSLGSIVLFIGVTLWFAGYLAARRADQFLTLIERHPWVRWRYRAEEWSAWCDLEQRRNAGRARPWNWRRDSRRGILALTLVSGTVVVFELNRQPLSWTIATVVAAGICTLGIIVAADRYGEAAPRRLRDRFVAAAPETAFGSDGVLADGRFTAWKSLYHRLVRAAIDDHEPASVTFVFDELVPGGYGRSIEVQRSVLVPAQRRRDIKRLHYAIAQTCPTALLALGVPSRESPLAGRAPARRQGDSAVHSTRA